MCCFAHFCHIYHTIYCSHSIHSITFFSFLNSNWTQDELNHNFFHLKIHHSGGFKMRLPDQKIDVKKLKKEAFLEQFFRHELKLNSKLKNKIKKRRSGAGFGDFIIWFISYLWAFFHYFLNSFLPLYIYYSCTCFSAHILSKNHR